VFEAKSSFISFNHRFDTLSTSEGCLILVRSKYSLTPKKLLQKFSQLILVGFSVLFNILKVYQSRTPGKVFFFPKPLNDHNSVTVSTQIWWSWCVYP